MEDIRILNIKYHMMNIERGLIFCMKSSKSLFSYWEMNSIWML